MAKGHQRHLMEYCGSLEEGHPPPFATGRLYSQGVFVGLLCVR